MTNVKILGFGCCDAVLLHLKDCLGSFFFSFFCLQLGFIYLFIDKYNKIPTYGIHFMIITLYH